MFPLETKPSFHILGLTRDQRVFRPSDWAERLAGIMAQFRDDQGSAKDRALPMESGPSTAYSSLVLPVFVAHPGHAQGDSDHVASLRAVLVSGTLYGVEPLAYEFLQQFAIDNDLITQTLDGPVD
ncbi:MAG: DUF3579 domain-containing protein [Betaproteobacteria bacterium]